MRAACTSSSWAVRSSPVRSSTSRSSSRFEQQVQGPVLLGQVEALPEVVAAAVGAFHTPPLGAFAEALDARARQRLQGLLGVAPRRDQTLAHRFVERTQMPKAPGRPVGQDDDVQRIGNQQDARLPGPFALHVLEFELDHQYAEYLAVLAMHRVGKKIAGNAGGHADGEVAPAVMGHGIAEIGAKGIVVADKARPVTPVARRDGFAVTVQQVEHRGAGRLVLLLQAQVQHLAQLAVVGSLEQAPDIAVERQQRRHRAKAFDLGVDRLGIEIELATRLLTALGPDALLGDAPGPEQAERQAKQDRCDDQDEAQAAGHGQKAQAQGKGSRREDGKRKPRPAQAGAAWAKRKSLDPWQ